MLQTLAPVMRAALVLLSICAMAGTKKAAKSLVTQVADQKEFKKLLRTKTNVMVLFTGNAKQAGEAATILGEVWFKSLVLHVSHLEYLGERGSQGSGHLSCH